MTCNEVEVERAWNRSSGSGQMERAHRRCYINSRWEYSRRWAAEGEVRRAEDIWGKRMPAAQHPGEGPCGARRWTLTITLAPTDCRAYM